MQERTDLDWSGLEILSDAECHEHLAMGAVGRIGFVDEGSPVILPVNHAVDGDTIVLTMTDEQTAKVTDAAEIATKGRGTAGMRLTKFRGEKRIEFAYVGPEAGVSLIVGTADAPSKPDNSPEPLTVPHTGRDLVSRKIPRRILAAGFGRW